MRLWILRNTLRDILVDVNGGNNKEAIKKLKSLIEKLTK